MSLIDSVRKHRSSIVKAWIDRVIATYAPDTALFLRSQSDRFANPVGQTVISCLEGLFDALMDETPLPEFSSILDPLIRIRAVQNFTPSQAVGFALELKPIIRQKVAGKRLAASSEAEWQTLETRIDALALLAFDIYVSCREQLYKLKVSTERDKTYRAFARAGLIAEIPDQKPGLEESQP